jgi:hypothetical protein
MALSIKAKIQSTVASQFKWLSKKVAISLGVLAILIPSLVGAFSYGAMVSVQPENGSLSGGTTSVADASASGGQSVKFGAPGPCPGSPDQPDGEDPWGGCWPGPETTGVPNGVTLTNYGGPCTINDYNSVSPVTISNVDATSTCPMISVQDNIDVNITNSKLPVINMTGASGTLTVTDSELHDGGGYYGVLWGHNIVAQRVHITGGQHSIHCEGACNISDSYMTGQNAPAGASTHNNAFISNGGVNMQISHNTLHCSPELNGADGGCTADLSLFGDFDILQDITISNNLFMATPSGGYCGSFGYNPGKPYGSNPTDIAVTNNVFQRGPNNKCGVYDATTSFLVGNGNTWSGNVWDDGGTINP